MEKHAAKNGDEPNDDKRHFANVEQEMHRPPV